MAERSYLYASNGQYRWRRQASNGEKIAASTEGYGNKQDATDNYYRVSGADAPELENLTDDD